VKAATVRAAIAGALGVGTLAVDRLVGTHVGTLVDRLARQACSTGALV